jgi:DNA-binding MarR family transcriptional regulator
MESTRWLTDEEQAAWRTFAAVMTLVPAALDGQMQRDSDITHFGYWVMAMLSEAPDRAMRMSELAARANGSQSRLSHLVAKLERAGYVRRERAGDDGRGFLAVLTDAGYAKVVEAAPGHVEKVRELIFDALDPRQVAQMAEICRAILTHAERCT